MCIYFHEGTENCSFEMAASPTPPTGWLTLPKSPLRLQGCIHCPSAASLHLPPGSTALSPPGSTALSPRCHCIAVKLHQEPQLGATMGCRKTRAHHMPGIPVLFSNKMNQPLDSIWKEMRNGYNVVRRRAMIRGKIIPLTARKAGRNSLAGINAGGHVRWLAWSLPIFKIY